MNIQRALEFYIDKKYTNRFDPIVTKVTEEEVFYSFYTGRGSLRSTRVYLRTLSRFIVIV